MADHMRKRIRDAAVAALMDLDTTGRRVFGNRLHPVGPESPPCLLVYTGTEEDSETAEVDTMGAPPILRREIPLVVDGYVAPVNGSVDDALDQVAAEVEAALDGNALGGLLSEGLALESTALTVGDTAASDPVGHVRLVFGAVYRTPRGVPTSNGN